MILIFISDIYLNCTNICLDNDLDYNYNILQKYIEHVLDKSNHLSMLKHKSTYWKYMLSTNSLNKLVKTS